MRFCGNKDEQAPQSSIDKRVDWAHMNIKVDALGTHNMERGTHSYIQDCLYRTRSDRNRCRVLPAIHRKGSPETTYKIRREWEANAKNRLVEKNLAVSLVDEVTKALSENDQLGRTCEQKLFSKREDRKASRWANISTNIQPVYYIV